MLNNYEVTEIKGISFNSIGEYFTGKPNFIDIFALLNIEKNENRESSYKLLKESSVLIENGVLMGLLVYFLIIAIIKY